MPDYLELGLTTDATTLYQDALDWLTAQAPPGWVPSPLEQWILAAVSRIGVEIAVLSGTVPMAIFTYFGQSILGVAPDAEAHATGVVTFTLTDTAGHTILAGAQIVINDVPFTTDADLVIPASSSTGNATVTAVDAGIAGNDLTGSTITLESPTYTWVDHLTLIGLTAHGTDAEDPADYADRLADELPTLSTKAILISDFEALARKRVSVTRALAIDNLNPPSTVAAGHITVAAHDSAGNSIGTSEKTALATDLDADRVLNLVVHVIDATYNTIDVTFTAVALAGYDAATVQADALAAIQGYLDPTVWGNHGTANQWVDEETVYLNNLIALIQSVEGVSHVTSAKAGKQQAVTGSASADTIALTANGFANDDPISFTGLAGGAPLANGTTYYVRNVATNTFKVATTAGGTPIDITTDMTAGVVHHLAAADLALTGPAALTKPGTISGTVT